MPKNEKIAKSIKAAAIELGFASCGISRASFLEDEAKRIEQWLSSGMHAGMQYMEKNFDKRVDPRRLFEGAKSVISVLHNYSPKEFQKDPGAPVVARYAYGSDYHFIIREKLNRLLEIINKAAGRTRGRGFVDSAPVLDRAWAVRSGLGWIGKNNCLITRGKGSFFFIGEVVADIELPPDKPFEENYCGDCRLCIDACPTGALTAPCMLDARKCISYLTTQHKGALPEKMRGKMRNRVYGCDICQDACPHNSNSEPHGEPLLEPVPEMLKLTSGEWQTMGEEMFSKIFGSSVMGRSGFKMVKRNLEFLKDSKAV